MYNLYIEKNISSKDYLKKVLKKYHIEYDIFYNEYGKPYLKNNELYFNISHSKDYTVLVTSDKEIGVDIQYLTYNEKTRDRICTEEERKKVKTDLDFTKIWTKKEAYIKKIGIGLEYGMKNVDTTKIDNIDIYKKDGYIIAICYEK